MYHQPNTEVFRHKLYGSLSRKYDHLSFQSIHMTSHTSIYILHVLTLASLTEERFLAVTSKAGPSCYTLTVVKTQNSST